MSRRPLSRDNVRGRSRLLENPARWQNFDPYPGAGLDSSFTEGPVAHTMSSNMTAAVLVWHEDSLGTYNAQVPACIGSTAGGNGFIGVRAYNLWMYATVRTTSGNISIAHTIPGGTIGNYALYHATWDGSTLRLWRQGVNVASTATTGTVVATTTGASVGGMNGADVCYAAGVVGCGFAENTLIASPAAHYAACVAANDYVSFSGEEFGYRASDYSGLTDEIAPIQAGTPVLPCQSDPSLVTNRWASFSRIAWAA